MHVYVNTHAPSTERLRQQGTRSAQVQGDWHALPMERSTHFQNAVTVCQLIKDDKPLRR